MSTKQTFPDITKRFTDNLLRDVIINALRRANYETSDDISWDDLTFKASYSDSQDNKILSIEAYIKGDRVSTTRYKKQNEVITSDEDTLINTYTIPCYNLYTLFDEVGLTGDYEESLHERFKEYLSTLNIPEDKLDTFLIKSEDDDHYIYNFSDELNKDTENTLMQGVDDEISAFHLVSYWVPESGEPQVIKFVKNKAPASGLPDDAEQPRGGDASTDIPEIPPVVEDDRNGDTDYGSAGAPMVSQPLSPPSPPSSNADGLDTAANV